MSQIAVLSGSVLSGRVKMSFNFPRKRIYTFNPLKEISDIYGEESIFKFTEYVRQ